MQFNDDFLNKEAKDFECWKKAMEEADNMGLDDEQTLTYVLAKLTEKIESKRTYKTINGKNYRLICNFGTTRLDFSSFPYKEVIYKIDAVKAAVEAHKEFDLVLFDSQCTPKDYIGSITEPGWSLFCGLDTIDLSQFWNTVNALEALQECQ